MSEMDIPALTIVGMEGLFGCIALFGCILPIAQVPAWIISNHCYHATVILRAILVDAYSPRHCIQEAVGWIMTPAIGYFCCSACQARRALASGRTAWSRGR